MKIPKKIEIFGKIYSLKIVEQALSIDNEDVAGSIDFEKNIIEITEVEDNKVILHNILHEVFHGVIRRIGINQANFSEDLEEIIVESFSTFLLDTFKIKFKKDLL